MQETSKTWESAAVIAALLAMFFVCGALGNVPLFSVISFALLPMIGALVAFLLQWRAKKIDLLFVALGLGLSYLGGILTNHFSWTDPFAVFFAAISLLYAIVLWLGKKYRLSRTSIVLLITVLSCIGFLAWGLGSLRWFLGPDFLTVFRNVIVALQEDLTAMMVELGKGTITEADVTSLFTQMLIMLPALMAMFAIVLAWFATFAYRFCCQKNNAEHLLPNKHFEITMSLFSAVLYTVLFFGAAVVKMFGNLYVYGAVQNVLLLLTPGFVYLQLRRTVFQIKHRQTPPNFWFYFVIVVLLVLVNFIEGLTVVGVLGAGGLIWRRIVAHAQKNHDR